MITYLNAANDQHIINTPVNDEILFLLNTYLLIYAYINNYAY